MYEEFSKTKASGEPHKCKFCHAEVWWKKFPGRWMDIGGQTAHSNNCELRKAHYSAEASARQEARRQARVK